MSAREISPQPMSAENFAPYGEVIQAAAATRAAMNDARFERFHGLAQIDVTDNKGRASISIARCRIATTFPHAVRTVERHPHGSQAFIPLSGFPFIVVVAAASDSVDPGAFRAFVTDGTQGVNYRKGIWHMPMIGMQAGQEFLIVDRQPASDNCDEVTLDEPLLLTAPEVR